jgi:hypothetical protein
VFQIQNIDDSHCVKRLVWLQVDYNRINGMRVADLINVGNTKPKTVPDKICLLLSIRLHTILLDTDLNGVSVVARNMHVAVAFSAMKFHRFVRALANKRLIMKPTTQQKQGTAEKNMVRVRFFPVAVIPLS